MIEQENESSDKSDIFDEWIDDNYKKFTSIGIFGGMSVYLTQLPIEISLPIQAGIAGSLLIFSILTLIILFDGIDKTILLAKDTNPEIFVFMLIITSLVGILVSVVTILSKYSRGAAPLLDAAFTVGIVVYYLTHLFSNNSFREVEPTNIYQEGIVYSPYIGAFWMMLAIAYRSVNNEPTLLSEVSWEPHFAGALTLVLTHFICTFIVFSCLAIAEYLTDRVPNKYHEIRKNFETK